MHEQAFPTPVHESLAQVRRAFDDAPIHAIEAASDGARVLDHDGDDVQVDAVGDLVKVTT